MLEAIVNLISVRLDELNSQSNLSEEESLEGTILLNMFAAHRQHVCNACDRIVSVTDGRYCLDCQEELNQFHSHDPSQDIFGFSS